MNLTRRQIALLIASILCFENEIDKNSQMCEELHELVEILDKEHQKLIEETK